MSALQYLYLVSGIWIFVPMMKNSSIFYLTTTSRRPFSFRIFSNSSCIIIFVSALHNRLSLVSVGK